GGRRGHRHGRAAHPDVRARGTGHDGGQHPGGGGAPRPEGGGRRGGRLGHRIGPSAEDRPVSGVPARPIRLGLRENLGQFSLLVGVNALVGAMVGQERTVLPLLGVRVFHLHAFTATLTYIVAFGVMKALTTCVAGTLSGGVGRKPVLVAGWLIGVPVPFLLAFGPAWGWIVFANVLLGINQGLTWSTTVIMKIDLVGPRRRGLAMGLNEAAGYCAVALPPLATRFIPPPPRPPPPPFFLALPLT